MVSEATQRRAGREKCRAGEFGDERASPGRGGPGLRSACPTTSSSSSSSAASSCLSSWRRTYDGHDDAAAAAAAATGLVGEWYDDAIIIIPGLFLTSAYQCATITIIISSSRGAPSFLSRWTTTTTTTTTRRSSYRSHRGRQHHCQSALCTKSGMYVCKLSYLSTHILILLTRICPPTYLHTGGPPLHLGNGYSGQVYQSNLGHIWLRGR